MNDVILLTGGNLGDRSFNLTTARERLIAALGPLQAASSLYSTAPWGVTDQPDFLNQVLIITTALPPDAVLRTILSIEESLGRVRTTKWAPRPIDIDILFYGSLVIDTPSLVVPHPEIPNRRFVLAPLTEVAPDLVHPVLGLKIRELLSQTPDTAAVTRL
ncbi:MAG TPA: 2-amino-4-hydroxy-6-hydroxymethyldihydropteridine diphosphokinase [Dinghuibacter sp.]|uniref:2-amino-4-hydroxy-6- hydroxymethyldihydropteridine diphosphokinase n=1 Tax=Dinghuibacter sp. TaxID=2024697 RepID=UPI002B7908A0|nr:2-amino-4-hydroxy-6-hydroxymethyldihydropteridine diphosphokinase [Dinghuibacter sp.]HTJ10440.1 2-amino-4-hydroxy-6-hydroxymethyldihydropteridine diphosphokinase [Dinghuibacter sp.]